MKVFEELKDANKRLKPPKQKTFLKKQKLIL